MTAGRYDILAEHRARTVAEKAELQIEQLSTSVEDLHTQVTTIAGHDFPALSTQHATLAEVPDGGV